MEIRNIGKGMALSLFALGWLVVTASPVYAADGPAVYEKTCKLCHGHGVAGAPMAGDANAWKPRIAKGKDVLYTHAIDGFRDKAFMPPRGSNRSLSDDEVKAAVDYMIHLVE